jgi:hypothetical protein
MGKKKKDKKKLTVTPLLKGRKADTIKSNKDAKHKKEVLKHRVGLDENAGNLPMGIACSVEVYELVADDNKIKGHIVELDAVAVGRKVQLRLNRDGTFKLWLVDGTGSHVAGEGERGDQRDRFADQRSS